MNLNLTLRHKALINEQSFKENLYLEQLSLTVSKPLDKTKKLINCTHMGRPNSSRSIAELWVTPSLSINIFLKVVTFTSISSGEYLNKKKQKKILKYCLKT